MKTRFAKSMLIASAIGMLGFTSCNDDDKDKFSKEEILQMQTEIVGYYSGSIAETTHGREGVVHEYRSAQLWGDSLFISIPTTEIANNVSSDGAKNYLRSVQNIRVASAYEFLSANSGTIHLLLHPTDVILPAGCGAPPHVKIVFSKIYGGDYVNQWMGFNIVAQEVWVNGVKDENFKSVQFRFEGDQTFASAQ